jgi:D-amino-acid oxidase
MPIRRRTTLQLLMATIPVSTFSQLSAKAIEQAKIPSHEPEPDMSDEMILRRIAGIRPFREGGFRIEHESISGKEVIHNYGHGGAGVTMSWGSAEEVVRLWRARCSESKNACVIGGGVIGLTSALLLREAGLNVRVCSEHFTPRTTSDVAGAQWSPSLVEVGKSEDQVAMFDRVLRSSFDRFSKLLDKPYGVSIRPNYVEGDHDTSFYKIPSGVIPEVQELEQLPFRSNPVSGRVFTTLFVQPPIFMPRLMADCRENGIALEAKKFESSDEFAELPESLIVNCTGAGAAELMGDKQVVPIRGQLVILKPQPLPWLLSHRKGYIFPREDGVVMGGTVERGVAEIENTAAGVDKILQGNREFFRETAE